MLPKLPPLRAAAPAALALSALLAGCANSKVAEQVCPGAAGLVEASSLTRFAPGSVPDPAHMLFRVDLTGVSTTCNIEKKTRTVDASLTLHFRATRSPTGLAADYTVPYFVAINSGAEIDAKQVFQAHFHFDPGQATTQFDENIDSAVIHVGRDKQAFDYQLLAGLQVTKEELDYNRKLGLYGP